MKKLFTLAAAVLASLAMSATTIFSYTLTAAGTDGTIYDAEGGTAKCVKTMASGGSNEITIGDQTFYKFNSSSAWEFTLADEGTFAEGDVVSITAACTTSDKKGKGVKLNGIAVTGDFPASTANTLTYTVQAGDAIDGKTTIRVERIDSDIKFGTIAVDREAPSTDPVESAEINGENACLAGGSIELTCSAPKATTYQWSMNGSEIAGATAKKYTFAPSAAGDYSFTCAASNEYNIAPVVSAAHVVSVIDPANIYGELITATLTSGSAATVTGLIGGTADVSLSSSKKMDKGKYFGITLASGNFKEGDTVVITMTTAGSNYPCLFADKERTNCLFLATEASSDLEYKIVLPAAANTLNTLYLARDGDDATYKWNPILSSMSVIRPETKTVVSTVESLTAVTINDYPLAAADFTKLTTAHTLILEDSAYVTAPVVKFTKHIVITYDDETTKEKDEVIEKISQQAQASLWGATVDIAGIAYTVYTIKPLSYTVTYKEGEQVLGTELVAANGNPAEFAKYESLPLSTFEGWYKDAELTQAVVSMAAEVISADVTFYAKFSKAYAQSIDFEQMVLIQGVKYDVKSALTAKFYDYKTIDALDSLNNSKGAGRNEPYLGLKIKKNGGYLACNVLPGTTIRIKFGYVAETVLAIAGNDTMRLVPTNNKIADQVFPIMVETLVKLQTTSDKTVVIKQIMVDEPLVTWMYPINYAETENGKVEGWAIAFPDETVTLTVTPNEGYKVASVTAGNEVVVPVEDVYSFVMPGQEVTVSATFTSDGTAIDNTEANVKAVKVVRNGQLLIEKNGVLFNAQGAVVR